MQNVTGSSGSTKYYVWAIDKKFVEKLMLTQETLELDYIQWWEHNAVLFCCFTETPFSGVWDPKSFEEHEDNY